MGLNFWQLRFFLHAYSRMMITKIDINPDEVIYTFLVKDVLRRRACCNRVRRDIVNMHLQMLNTKHLR